MSALVILKKHEDKRIIQGHLWAFSNEIQRVEQPGEPGCVAELRSSEGKPLGVGFYHPHSLIAFRLLDKDPQAVIGREWFERKISDALARRGRHYPGSRSFRLCFGESDGLPGLVIDRYDSILVLQVLSAGMERCLGHIEQALGALLKPRGILLKNDVESRRLEGLPLEVRILSGEVPETVEFEEDGIRLAVCPQKGQKTGYFFDQRDNRSFLRPYFKGRRVLDLYCYVGGFALNAVFAGAAEVLAADSSAKAVELARHNAKLNGFQDKAAIQKEDAAGMLEAFSRGELPFNPDMVVLDPPNLAPTKKSLAPALRLYARLNTMALSGLKTGGLLATASCSHHLPRGMFAEMLREAAMRAGKTAHLVALRSQARDHPVLLAMPETQYLNFALLEVV